MSHNVDKPRVATAAVTDDEIAPDLSTLMERMVRVRKFLYIEREYIKMILMGIGFFVIGSAFSNMLPWMFYMGITLMATPWLFAWYNLPLAKLANAFRNEVLPFLLRDYGRWNYTVQGTHFSAKQFVETGLIHNVDLIGISNIMTGERFGVPLQMAVLYLWPRPRFGLYRGSKPLFSGWCASIRLPELPAVRCLILPTEEKPADPALAGWTAVPVMPTHQLWVPPGQKPELPAPLVARLLKISSKNAKARFAISDSVLWLMVPSAQWRFDIVRDFKIDLSEMAPYQRARTELAEMFEAVDAMVWPEAA